MQLGVRDAARILNVSEKMIYRWISQGDIPAYRVNEQYRFNRAELLEWATAKKIQVSVELVENPESSATPLPSLSAALQTGGIHYRLPGTDKVSVLRALVEVMRLPEEIDRQFLVQVLLAREGLGSTGIGDGIAIPHVRHPIVLHVPRPSVTLCFLEQPIDFGAIDGQPVHTLFSLISPTVRTHLHLLSRLAFALRDPGTRQLIAQRGPQDQIMAEVHRLEQSFPAPAAKHGGGG